MRTCLKTFLCLAVAAALFPALPARAGDVAGTGMTPPAASLDDDADRRSLTPEKQAKYNEIIKAAEEAMLPLREQMLARRIQIETMAGMPNMDHEAIAKLAAEIAALHTQMIRVHDAMADRLSKEVGIAVPRGTCSDGYTPCFMHRGMPGYGMDGMTRGHHHRNMTGLLPIMPAF